MGDHGWCACMRCEYERRQRELAVMQGKRRVQEARMATPIYGVEEAFEELLARPVQPVVMNNDHTTGLLPEEAALIKRQKQDTENLKELHRYDRRIADAEAVLTRYNRQVVGLGSISALTLSMMLTGAIFITGAYVALGWVLMFVGILGTFVFGGKLSTIVFEAHKLRQANPGHTISLHPAEVVRRIEREKLAFLDTKS